MIALQAETYQWIDQTCRRLSDATGWPIRFVRREFSEAAGDDAALLVNAEDHCWSMGIGDGEGTVGWLQMELPADARRDRAFTAVCEVASLTGELMCRALQAEVTLDRRTNDVATLVDIGMSLSKDAAPLNTLDRLLHAAVELTGFRAAAFFLLSPSVNQVMLRSTVKIERELIALPSRELETGTPDLAALARGKHLVRRHGKHTDDRWLPSSMSIGYCLAVQSDDGPLGTLWVYDRRLRIPEQREISALESIAAQLASVLERVVLLEENAVQSRMQRDLQSASASHVNTLSSRHRSECVGADLAARCTSRFELGGDLCEVIRIDETRTVIAVGDASGDSVPAAMVMSAVRGSLRTLADDTVEAIRDTSAVMRRINRTLHQITPAYQFMSLIYAVFDADDNSLTYTNAGHPTPVLISDTGTRELESHGLLLGVDADTIYGSSRVELQTGDLLAMFSDGVTEARCGRRQLFGSEGVSRALSEAGGKSANELLDRVWAEVDAHASESGAADDRTLLVMRVSG